MGLEDWNDRDLVERSQTAVRALLCRYQPMVRIEAVTLGLLPPEDYQPVGELAVVRAIIGYDSSAGVTVRTFIQSAIQNVYRDELRKIGRKKEVVPRAAVRIDHDTTDEFALGLSVALDDGWADRRVLAERLADLPAEWWRELAEICEVKPRRRFSQRRPPSRRTVRRDLTAKWQPCLFTKDLKPRVWRAA